MTLLLVKLLLAPCLVGLATLAGRRWGSGIAGWLAGFPLVAGPLLLALALEHGPAFAQAAASAALLGLVALCVYAWSYAWLSPFFPVPICMISGWSGYVLVCAAQQKIPDSWVLHTALVGLAIVLARWWLPKAEGPVAPVRPWKGDIWVRMASTALLVLGVAELSSRLGPTWSGLLTPFPVATTILTVFTHLHSGPREVAKLLRGFLPGLVSLGGFFLALHLGLASLPLAGAFGLALGVSTALHVLVWIGRQRLF